jgi:G6PDH family F420-dependent oxidoreductase
MTTFGYFLSSEEFAPGELLEQARLAEDAGFESLWLSDHFHPWNDEQGESPFVWSMLGALSQLSSLPVTTAVTCPTVRIHPAVIAQAAATTSLLFGGRFVLGVGSGEALNEQVLGDPWPLTDVRLEMLEEAVHVMRTLWTGDVVTHRGRHYTVEHARIYSRPETPPKVYLSGFGPASIELAGRIADGYMTTQPDADAVESFRKGGGAGKPVQGGLKVCWSTDAAQARKSVHRIWPNSGLPGELSQVLRTPEHFQQASSIVTEEMVAKSTPCGNDVDEHVAAAQAFVDAGFDEVYVNQIGPDQKGFFDFYRAEVLPRLR